jgi:hypothetical protein
MLQYFKIDADGTAPEDIDGIDTIIIVSANNIFGLNSNPCASMVYNSNGATDTGYVFYKYWANVADPDSFDICYRRFILGSPVTLGAQVIMKAAVGVEGATNGVDTALISMQSPPRIYNIDDVHRLVVAYTDSTAAAVEDLVKLYVLFDSVFVGTGTPTGGTRVKVRK